MTWKRDLYPDNWLDIALAVKRRAGWRCERCGRPHDPEAGYTLTVHHLDGNPQNCADDNLVALCQRCHLHVQNTYIPGQLAMPWAEPWLERKQHGYPQEQDH